MFPYTHATTTKRDQHITSSVSYISNGQPLEVDRRCSILYVKSIKTTESFKSG